MSNKYDDIDYCLNLLYDFVYGKSNKCYKLQYESLKDIPIEKLKKNPDYDYSKFFKGGDFTYLRNIQVPDSYDCIVFKRMSKTTYGTTIKVGLYNPKDTTLHNIERKPMNDMKMNYILSDVSINDPNKKQLILLPIFNFDIEFSKLEKMENTSQIIKEIKKTFKNIKNNDILYFQIVEHYFKQKTLKEYLDENKSKINDDLLKIISFQILYILYRIQNAHNGFRHNKLNLDSVYVYQFTESKSKEIKVMDNVFNVPTGSVDLRITNFYNATTDKSKENQYYDLHYFFSSLYFYIKNNNIKAPLLLDFINKIISDKFRSSNEKKIELDEEYYKENVVTILYPSLILTKNNFFIDFIKGNINTMNSPLSNSSGNLSEYRNISSSVDYMLSSSLSESGYGNAPSNLARKSGKNNSVKGTREISTKLENIQDGGAGKREKSAKHVSPKKKKI